MTAIASPPSFSNINRPAWGVNGGQPSLNSMNPDDVRGMFMPRKTLQRTNSGSSISSNSSASSTSTTVSSSTTNTNNSSNYQPNGVAVPLGEMTGWQNRKRPQPKAAWPAGKPHGQQEFPRMPENRPPMAAGMNGASAMHQPQSIPASQGQIAAQGGMPRPMTDLPGAAQPVLYLLSLNGTFERKTISVPFLPETLRIGRQTNMKTVPTAINGFFDSKVLSRQHAEIWADRSGKIWIRDVKSSNGTFVNGTRLSQENRESEPHELQTSDHLELGIDIVSEDQKSVVHHKVAAKVEHAGYLNHANSLLDMSFGDLDPANGMMMLPQNSAMHFRGRQGSQASVGANGRMTPAAGMSAQANGMVQRGFLMPNSQPSTELIVKKLHQEMRNARLQSQDLGRTHQFLNALLSKEDLKNQEKPDVPEQPKSHLVNGNNVSFRGDAKSRFSDPPAPPPQQPLPEKPDVPSLKRGTTERPKSHPVNTTSPIRQDNLSQIIQLTEALNSAKREIDTHAARILDLEEMVRKEREAREIAEEQNRRLEDAAASRDLNGSAKPEAADSILDETFEPPAEAATSSATPAAADDKSTKTVAPPPQIENVEASATLFQVRMETMMTEMRDLKIQLGGYKQRAEVAEAERDADRRTLAEMVMQIRQRDEEEAKSAGHEDGRRSRSKRRPGSSGSSTAGDSAATSGSATDGASDTAEVKSGGAVDDPADEQLALSRADTITPSTDLSRKAHRDQVLIQGIPYASMLGVVILGMGLMAYINGWQPQPRVDR